MMVDGEMVGHIGDAVLRDRRRLAREGAVLVVTSVPPRGETPAVGPEVLSVGVGMEGVRVALDLEATRAVSALLEEPDTRTLSREELKEAICARVRGIYRRALDKRPLVVPVIIEE